jgi:hypothetical protein
MFTTYFDEYQKQFSEWQKQVNDWQKKFFDTWLDSLPKTKGDIDFAESFDKALSYQEELVKSYLEAQEKTTEMMLDAQRKFWNDYFEALRKKSAQTSSPV